MKRRGASLVWAVVLCGVMMLVVGTMSAFIIKESRMSIRMDDSARAYAAAESGLDWGKLCLVNYSCRDSLAVTVANSPKFLSPSTGMALNGAKYYVKISVNAAGDYTINSRGESNLVNREIEYKFAEANSVSIDRDFEDDGLTPKTDDDHRIPTGSITADSSFTVGFYYWVKDAASMADNAIFGIQNPSAIGGKDEISVSINQRSFDLNVIDKNGAATRTGDPNFAGSTADGALNLLPADKIDAPYALYISIKYLRNTSARLTIMLYNPATGNYDCRGTKTVYLPNKTLSFGGTTTKFVHEFTAGTAGNFERIEGKPAVDPGSRLNEADNFLYRFSSPAASPTRFGYLDNFSSTGISYLAPSSFNLTVTTSPLAAATATGGGVKSTGSSVTPGYSSVNTGYTFTGWSPATCASSFNIVSTVTCTALFSYVPPALPGFSVGSTNKYTYLKIYDWDSCLFSAGINESSIGGPSFSVDGHIVYEAVYDSGVVKLKVLESTGGMAAGYAQSRAVNTIHTIASTLTGIVVELLESDTVKKQNGTGCSNVGGRLIRAELSNTR